MHPLSVHQPHEQIGKLLALVCLLTTAQAFAQISVELDLDRQNYIRYEPVSATVTLRNNTGNTLLFGSKDAPDGAGGYLRFQAFRGGGLQQVRVEHDTNPAEDLILGPGETRTLTIRINSIVDMSQVGTYTLSVRVGHPRLRQDYLSQPVPIDIRRGTPIWSHQIGVPQDSTTDIIPTRTVSLLRFRKKDGESYAMRLEDDENVFGIARLGPYLAGAEPDCHIDAMSNIHLLFQIHPRLYSYRIYSVNMELKQNLYYIMKGSIPRLKRDKELGSVRVVGGQRAVPGKDYRIADGSKAIPQPLQQSEKQDDGLLANPRR